MHDDIDTNRAGFLVGTPALLREYESCCATNSYDGLQLDGGSRSDVPVLQEYEHLIDSPATSYGQLVVYQTSAIEAEAQQAIRPEAIALAVFGVIALLAALIIGTQADLPPALRRPPARPRCCGRWALPRPPRWPTGCSASLPRPWPGRCSRRRSPSPCRR